MLESGILTLTGGPGHNSEDRCPVELLIDRSCSALDVISGSFGMEPMSVSWSAPCLNDVALLEAYTLMKLQVQ